MKATQLVKLVQIFLSSVNTGDQSGGEVPTRDNYKRIESRTRLSVPNQLNEAMERVSRFETIAGFEVCRPVLTFTP